MKKHILKLEVRNQPGILARVAGLFNRRAYNIDSFSSGMIREGIFGMTIVVSCDDNTVDLIKKQLGKLIDVVNVEELQKEQKYELEIILIKIDSQSAEPFEEMAQKYQTTIIESNDSYKVYRLSGTTAEIDEVIVFLQSVDYISMNRSGAVAI